MHRDQAPRPVFPEPVVGAESAGDPNFLQEVIAEGIRDMREMHARGHSPSQDTDKDLADWAVLADDAALAREIPNPGRCVLTLAAIAKNTNSQTLADEAAEMAAALPEGRNHHLIEVSIILHSVKPLEHESNPGSRDSMTAIIAARLRNLTLLGTVKDSESKNSALRRMAVETRNPGLIDHISSAEEQELARRMLASAQEGDAIAAAKAKSVLADLPPLDHIDHADISNAIRQYEGHLSAGGHDSATIADIAIRMAALLDQLPPDSQYSNASWLIYLAEQTGNSAYAYQAIESARNGKSIDKSLMMATAIVVIRKLQDPEFVYAPF